MKRLLLVLSAAYALLTTAQAQDYILLPDSLPTSAPVLQQPGSNKQKNPLVPTVGVTTGTTGVGFDLSFPINDLFSVRAGYALMPRFTTPLRFELTVGDVAGETSKSKFAKMADILYGNTGFTVSDQVDMMAKPTFWNAKLMVDAFPFRNKHWHVTAGVYLGNRQIGEAVNEIDLRPFLMAVATYNRMYEKAMRDEEFLYYNGQMVYHEAIAERMKSAGIMSVLLGTYSHDILYQEDVIMENPNGDFIGDEYYDYGDVIHHKGDVKYHKGDIYHLMPDENCEMRAFCYANRFKPYIGFGYEGRLSKSSDWNIGFDCGVMFWGGVPTVVTHDGTNLVKDVENLMYKTGDYIRVVKKFPAYPVLNLRLSRKHR